MKHPYLIEVVIPSLATGSRMARSIGVRDERLREFSIGLFNRFGVQVHVLKRKGAVAVKLTAAEAQSITHHPSVKSVRKLKDD
jgi:hypothetical protein